MDYSSFIHQLDTLLDLHRGMQSRSKYKDLSDISQTERQALVTRSIAAIDRISGPRSTYSREAQRLIEDSPRLHEHTSAVLGVVQALRDDMAAGSLQSLSALAHAEVFSDFLDMAEYLNGTGYKDAAAVIAGSTLEGHLRELASKNGIAINDAAGKPVKAERLNADLAKAAVYHLLDQKSVTANLDLRNKAAHGHYSDYTAEQVQTLILSVTDFIRRTPA